MPTRNPFPRDRYVGSAQMTMVRLFPVHPVFGAGVTAESIVDQWDACRHVLPRDLPTPMVKRFPGSWADGDGRKYDHATINMPGFGGIGLSWIPGYPVDACDAMAADIVDVDLLLLMTCEGKMPIKTAGQTTTASLRRTWGARIRSVAELAVLLAYRSGVFAADAELTLPLAALDHEWTYKGNYPTERRFDRLRPCEWYVPEPDEAA